MDLAEVGAWLRVDEVVAEPLGERYNVAPTDPVHAVAEHGGVRRLGTFRWGLVPPWAEDLRAGSRMINARAETLRDKPAFRRAFERRRCLVVADGFYEWSGGHAYHLRPRARPPVLAFAGLWETWRGGGPDAVVRSCAVVTTTANVTMAAVHDRMPVVLAPEAWDRWLDPDERDLDALAALLVPAPEDLLELVPVGPAVGNVRNDGPSLLDPVPV